ncbi:MAG: hypothetical protein ACTSU5_20505 [Promethearchaeota archaeon]
MSPEEMSISVLGDMLKCQQKKCDEFASVTQLKLSKDRVIVSLSCPQHPKKPFTATFSHAQFQKLIEVGLIDEKDVKTYQFKYMVLFGKYLKLEGGYDRVFVLDDKELIQQSAQKLFLCPKCSGINNLRVQEIRIPKKKKKKPAAVVIYQSCPHCGHNGGIALKIGDFQRLVKTGLVDPDIARDFREKLEMENWTPDEGYGLTASILAPHAAEALGLVGERERRCLMCGEPVAKGLDRCPNCGNDLET